MPGRIKQVTLKPGAYLWLALAFLLLPFRWLAAFLLAAAFHEGCHLLALRLIGVDAAYMEIGAFGAQIEPGPLTLWQELLAALAGPFGGLLLLPLAKWFPRLAVCAAVQSLYNLLPLYPMDGGRVLRCGAELLLPARLSGRLCAIVEILCRGAILVAGIYGFAVLRLGLLPLFLGVAAVIRATARKIPCKPGGFHVQ